VVPLVRGESLRQKLEREKRIGVDAALAIIRQVGAALEYAHREGVIHRDLKPENILLHEGEAMLVDFGIALAARDAAGSRLTETGLSLGTPQYMSPEQAAGERELTVRSDVYSLGAVLYEMLVGEPPHSGPTAQAVIARIITEQPVPLDTVRPEVPPSVAVAVQRALAKQPGDRFANAAEFLAALESGAVPARAPVRRRRQALLLGGLVTCALLGAWLWQRSQPRLPPGPPAIATLPFRVADPALAMYREGLVDYFASALDGAGGLRTIGARTSLKRWYAAVGAAGDGDDAAQDRVARSLGAHYVLTGEVIPLGAEIKLRVHVHDLAHDSAYASEADGSPDSIAALAERVGAEVLRHIAGSAARLVTGGPFATTSLEALKAYLVGEKAFREARYPDAIAAFDRAIAADSTFALAQFRRAAAEGWTMSPHNPGWLNPTIIGSLPKLGRHDSLLVRGSWELSLQNQLSLHSFEVVTREYPEDAEGWYLLGDAYYHIGMVHGVAPERVDSAFRRAIALDSTFAPAYLHLIEDAFQRSDSSESGTLIRALARFDSVSPKTTGLRLAWALAFGTEAERQAAKAQLPTLGADALLPAKHAMNLNPDLAQWTELVGRAIYANPRNDPSARAQGIGGAGQSFELRGQFSQSWPLLLKAQALIDSITGEVGHFWPDQGAAVYRVEGLPVHPGWESRPAPDMARFDDPFNSDPGELQTWGIWAIAHSRWELVSQVELGLLRASSAIQAYSDTAAAPFADTATIAQIRLRIDHWAAHLKAWAGWARHPTTQSLGDFAQATDDLRTNDVGDAATSDFILGKAYLELGDLAKAKRRMLTPQRWSSGFFMELIVPREYYLGRIAEAQGDRATAREHYARFVRWWRDCDPELKPMWEDGRRRLAQVSGEPQVQ
jgi:serine/threonine-protein kinase